MARWLRTAIVIDPDDQIARCKLILNGVAHSTHAVPVGYLGNFEADQLALARAASLLECLSDERLRQELSTDVSQLMAVLQALSRSQRLVTESGVHVTGSLEQ